MDLVHRHIYYEGAGDNVTAHEHHFVATKENAGKVSSLAVIPSSEMFESNKDILQRRMGTNWDGHDVKNIVAGAHKTTWEGKTRALVKQHGANGEPSAIWTLLDINKKRPLLGGKFMEGRATMTEHEGSPAYVMSMDDFHEIKDSLKQTLTTKNMLSSGWTLRAKKLDNTKPSSVPTKIDIVFHRVPMHPGTGIQTISEDAVPIVRQSNVAVLNGGKAAVAAKASGAGFEGKKKRRYAAMAKKTHTKPVVGRAAHFRCDQGEKGRNQTQAGGGAHDTRRCPRRRSTLRERDNRLCKCR
jgi:hypothetical protein